VGCLRGAPGDPTLTGGRRLALLGAAIAALALPAFTREALGFPAFYLVLLGTIWFWSAQATSWSILSGYSGYFSFGQGAFVGLGAYTTAVLSGRHGVDFLLTLPVSAALSTLLALAIGWLAFRLRSLRGEIFALLTLGVPFILASLARVLPAIDGGQGVVLPIPLYADAVGGFQALVYLLFLAVAGVAVLLAFAMQRTRYGWALLAIRDAEEVAEGLGVPTFRHKMLAIALNGLIAGVGGSIFALQLGFVTVESVFGLTVPLFVIVMSVLGGSRHWLGPTLGAAVIVLLQDRLSASGFEGWSLVILGLTLALLVIIAPDGLVARLDRRPGVTAGAVVLPIVALAVIGSWGSPLDWVVVGLVSGTLSALWPGRSRRPAEIAARRPRAQAMAGTAARTSTVTPAVEALRSLDRVVASADGAVDVAGGVPPPADAGATLVACRDVTKLFGGVRALDGVSLDIREGEIVGLVGPNGSGKSTLVGLISGAVRPTSGEILVAGTSIAGMAPHRIAHLGIARTYQIPRPFESLTVRDNIALTIMFGRTPRPLGEARRAADEHLALVGLETRADALPRQVNLHQRQLLEMARALATRPRVLLLDEALAGLNPTEIDQAVAVVRRMHEAGIAILIVEHILRVVNQLAHRVIVLDQGMMLAEGDPASVMRDPHVVHAYLGHARA